MIFLIRDPTGGTLSGARDRGVRAHWTGRTYSWTCVEASRKAPKSENINKFGSSITLPSSLTVIDC